MYLKKSLKFIAVAAFLIAGSSQAAFVDNFTSNYNTTKWPDTFKIYPGRESNYSITGLGDFTGATFSGQVRRDSSSTTALVTATVTTSADDGGTVLINLDDDDTANLNGLGNRLWMALDVTIGGELYPFYAGYVDADPFGTGLPVQVTTIEYEDVQAELDTAVSAAQAAQAAAEAAAQDATGINDGDKGDITVSSGGAVWSVDEAGVTQHEAALTILKTQITSFSDADYATAAQGVLADSATQPADNISTLTNDSGFITSYTVTEGDVTGVLDGATLTSATVAATDKVLVQDADDSDNLKTVTAQSIADLGGGGGSVDWTATQTSSTADGASNNAFDLQADVDYSLGNVLRVGDAGNADLFSVDGSGDITTSYLQTDNGTGFFQISRSTKILNNLAITGSFSAANGWVTLGGSPSSFGSLVTAGSAYLTVAPGGDLNLKAPTSTSTTLANSQISFSLDEGGNNLIVTAKYSDGTSKTATIAFD